jgi:hypothetical protein
MLGNGRENVDREPRGVRVVACDKLDTRPNALVA